MLLPYLNENLIEAGCDEAGRGCLAGAVYAAAVILPKNFKNEMLMFIAADLERKYDVNIYFDNYKASTFRFYAHTHRCEHVEEVLDLLRYTQKIDYRVDGRDIYIRLHE